MVAYTRASIVVWCDVVWRNLVFELRHLSRRLLGWAASHGALACSSSQLASCSGVQLLPSSSMCCLPAAAGTFLYCFRSHGSADAWHFGRMEYPELFSGSSCQIVSLLVLRTGLRSLLTSCCVYRLNSGSLQAWLGGTGRRPL